MILRHAGGGYLLPTTVILGLAKHSLFCRRIFYYYEYLCDVCSRSFGDSYECCQVTFLSFFGDILRMFTEGYGQEEIKQHRLVKY